MLEIEGGRGGGKERVREVEVPDAHAEERMPTVAAMVVGDGWDMIMASARLTQNGGEWEASSW